MTKREYLLVCLAEECGEVQRAVAKALRFGLTDICPENHNFASTNIMSEMANLVAVYRLLCDDGALSAIDEQKIANKGIRLAKYMEYSRSVGKLDE